MRRIAIAIGLLAGCGRLGFDPIGIAGDGGPDPWVVGTHSYRKRIAIESVVTADLVDYPISIETTDPQIGLHARSDGADLLFAAEDGTPLSHELVEIVPATGAVDAWVAVPQLPGGVITTIYLYYGGAPVVPASPWLPAFAGVWHMSRTCALVTDSANGHAVQPTTTQRTPIPTRGIAGVGCDFDGNDDAMEVADPVDGSLDFGLASFSFSVWVFATVSADLYDIALHKGGSNNGDAGYDFELGMDDWSAHVGDSSATIDADAGNEVEYLNQWVHLVAVANRPAATFTIYANGTPKASRNITGLGSIDSDDPLSFGRATNTFFGVIDEPRIYRGALSAEWIQSEHAHIVRRDELIVVGREEAR